MSPKVADPAVRVALIEQAARITAEEGRDGLSLRRLASDVGVSTMAVYTHFGGMEGLLRAVRIEGFARLAAHLDAVDDTGDTIADLVALGRAYYRNARANPNLYRAMFMDGPVDEADRPAGLETFGRLVRGVERCIDAGRIDHPDACELAKQLWALQHGAITLQLAGMMTPDEALECADGAARSILRACGDSPAALTRSYRRALARTPDTPS